MKNFTKLALAACVALGGYVASTAVAANLPTQGANDWPMWGRTPDRNMVTPEKGVPTDWDVETAEEHQVGRERSARRATATRSSPAAWSSSARTTKGTRTRSIPGDASRLMIFDEKTGKFLYQRVSAKLQAGRVNDWPYQGVCSTACVEGDRMWYCTPRCEVVCLDLEPLKRDGGGAQGGLGRTT